MEHLRAAQEEEDAVKRRLKLIESWRESLQDAILRRKR
jgi:hypothetical protein